MKIQGSLTMMLLLCLLGGLVEVSLGERIFYLVICAVLAVIAVFCGYHLWFNEAVNFTYRTTSYPVIQGRLPIVVQGSEGEVVGVFVFGCGGAYGSVVPSLGSTSVVVIYKVGEALYSREEPMKGHIIDRPGVAPTIVFYDLGTVDRRGRIDWSQTSYGEFDGDGCYRGHTEFVEIYLDLGALIGNETGMTWVWD